MESKVDRILHITEATVAKAKQALLSGADAVVSADKQTAIEISNKPGAGGVIGTTHRIYLLDKNIAHALASRKGWNTPYETEGMSVVIPFKETVESGDMEADLKSALSRAA